MKILLVEDDAAFAGFLRMALSQQRYQVDTALDGQQGWELAEVFPYDLILLDLVLPKLDGVTFCRQLRSASSLSNQHPNQNTPILLMTALDNSTKRVQGLDAGADDYVVKPVTLEELMARIRALRRRSSTQRTQILRHGQLILDQETCEVAFKEQRLGLTQKEYQLLELFLRHPDRVFSQARLIELLWDTSETPTENAVRSQIKGLRNKLKQAGAGDIIQTIYKLGYRLRQAEAPPADASSEEAIEAGTPVTLTPELWAVWKSCRQSYYDRLSRLEMGLGELQSGMLTPALKQEMEREAHTLAGSLGSFGLETAARLAQQMEHLLQQDVVPGLDAQKQLQRLLALLRQAMVSATLHSPNTPPSSPLEVPRSPLSLLIVGKDEAFIHQLSSIATAWDIAIATASDPAQAQAILTHQSPDAILLGLSNQLQPTELEFLQYLQQVWSELPVLVLAASSHLNDRVSAARAGVKSYLEKPIAPARVLAEVIQTVQQAEAYPASLLIVDDDPAILRRLQQILSPEGYRLTLLKEADQFWPVLEKTAPDLLILDINLSGYADSSGPIRSQPLNGLDLCRVIRNDPYWNQIPIIFLSVYSDPHMIQQGFEAGADDFLDKLSIPDELSMRVHKRLEKGKLQQFNEIDSLTGLGYRRRVMQKLTWLLQMAHRQEQSLVLALIDLDHFKRVNDQHGHEIGDMVLSSFGKLLDRSFRGEDVVGRWGGEEFIVGMYGTTHEDGLNRLREVLRIWQQETFSAPDGSTFQVTFSAGVAQYDYDGTELEGLQQIADQRLYQAKANGRNRVLGQSS